LRDGVQFKRQKELLRFIKEGYFVVAGGSYASLCPEAYESFADTVIAVKLSISGVSFVPILD